MLKLQISCMEYAGTYSIHGGSCSPNRKKSCAVCFFPRNGCSFLGSRRWRVIICPDEERDAPWDRNIYQAAISLLFMWPLSSPINVGKSSIHSAHLFFLLGEKWRDQTWKEFRLLAVIWKSVIWKSSTQEVHLGSDFHPIRILYPWIIQSKPVTTPQYKEFRLWHIYHIALMLTNPF